MLRIHFMQQWYVLSDSAMEDALYEDVASRLIAPSRHNGAPTGPVVVLAGA